MANIMKAAAVAILVLAGSQAVLGCSSPVPCPPAPNGCDPLPGTCPLPSSVDAQLEWVIDDNGDLNVFLQNTADVAGFQFDVVCNSGGEETIAQFSEVISGISLDSGFTVQFGNAFGRVLGFSLTLNVIPPSDSFKLLVKLGFESECNNPCVRETILSDSVGTNIPFCGPCDQECNFPSPGDLVGCAVNPGSDPIVPGIDAIDFDVGVFLFAPTESDITIYMSNTAAVAGFQFILRCEDSTSDDSNVIIQATTPGQVVEDASFQLLSNIDIILSFSLSGTSIPPGFSELLSVTLSASCPASEICIDETVFSDPLAESLTMCGSCGDECLCEFVDNTPPVPSPLPPSPPAIPDNVAPFIINICTGAGLFNFVILADLDTNTYLGTDEAECIVGTSGSDSILGGGGDDIIFGLAGDDYINGGDGSDVIYGNVGLDQLVGYLGDDAIYGGLGNDLLLGDFGDDYLSGEEGFDTLSGGPGFDTLVGGPANDKFLGCSPGEDVFQDFGAGDKVICPSS